MNTWMNKWCIFIFISFLFLDNLQAQDKKLSSPDPKLMEQYKKLTPEQRKQLENEVDKDTVEQAINAITQKIIKEKASSKILQPELQSYAATFLFFSKATNIEKETKIYKDWYKQIADCIALMANARMKEESAIMNNNSKHMATSSEEINILKSKLDEILKNPLKIPTGTKKQ
jgi:hypothetical protein